MAILELIYIIWYMQGQCSLDFQCGRSVLYKVQSDMTLKSLECPEIAIFRGDFDLFGTQGPIACTCQLQEV